MQASSKGDGSMNFNGISIYDNDLQPLVTATPVQASINVNLPDFISNPSCILHNSKKKFCS